MTDNVTDAPKQRGRPKNSRNKSNLMKAQVMIDDLTIEAVLHAEALMKNDTDFLKCKSDVPYTVRFNAMKEILAKGIANEKEKDAVKPNAPGNHTTEDGEKVHTGPQVFAHAAN